jgi:hypothetical protein
MGVHLRSLRLLVADEIINSDDPLVGAVQRCGNRTTAEAFRWPRATRMLGFGGA